MIGISTLWLPILLSAVFVFIASTIVHMVLRYHVGDHSPLPGEDRARAAMKGVPPGNYSIPHCTSFAEMGKPEMVEKLKEGPVGLITIWPSGTPRMGKQLTLWFLYSVAVGVVVAYVAGRTLAPGEHYLGVFRIAGTVAFLTYAGAEPAASIWKGIKWSTTLKHVLDGLIYALVTAGTFGWLWPA